MLRPESVRFNEFFPSQSKVPGGKDACTVICVLMAWRLSKIQKAADIFTVDWTNAVKIGADVHSLWRFNHQKETGEEGVYYITAFEALNRSDVVNGTISAVFSPEEVGGISVLHSPICEPGVYYSIEELVGRIGNGSGACVTSGMYTFLIFRVKDRFILYDSHGIQSDPPYSNTTVHVTAEMDVFCAEIRRMLSLTTSEKVGVQDASDMFSAVILHKK